MTKIIEIENCSKCPHYLKDVCAPIWECGLNHKRLDNFPEIPKWCPLPDKEENGFIKWLDELIESMALDEEASNMATHEHHEYLGIIRGLQIVKDKTEELGL